VTDNTKDFPSNLLEPYGIEVKNADDFIADSIDLSPSRAIAAVREMRTRLNNPAKTSAQLLLDMEKEGLTNTADQLRDSTSLF